MFYCKKGLSGMVVLLVCLAWADGTPPVGLEWSTKFSLPPQEDGRAAVGVGTPFFGEHNGYALLAGGSNFPDTPLIQGGKKRYYADIYALSPGSTNWVRAGCLSQPVAEGMSAPTPRGIVCVGGSLDGKSTSRTFLLTWDKAQGQAVETALPDFPCGVRLGAAAAKDNRVYAVGGEHAESLSSDVWVLDLDAPQAKWRPLPALPGVKGRTLAVAFVQNGDQKKTLLYVIGGYAKNAKGIIQSLIDGFAYDLAQPEASGRWYAIASARPKGSDKPAWPLIGAKCMTSGDQYVFFFGGLDAEYFDDNQRKMAALTGAAREAQRIAYQSTMPTSWNKQVLIYHTVTDCWFALGEVPLPPTVAGAAVKRADGSILLASGEIQPGIRTPLCIVGKILR